MMSPGDVLCFGPFRLRGEAGPLSRSGTRIVLRPKASAVLWQLASHSGELISKDALIAAVWRQQVISEGSLSVCIREIRKALGDDRHEPRYVQTVHRLGYRFVARLQVQASPQADVPAGGEPNAAGARVFGREPELRRLDRYLAEADSGRRRLVFVGGEAGIGKSALIGAWVARLGAEQRAWFGYGCCLPRCTETAEPFAPLLQAFNRLCQGALGARAAAALRRHAPTWWRELAARVRTRGAEPATVAADIHPEPLRRELAGVVEALCAARTLVLVLEDLHWSDAHTIEALLLLARVLPQARLLIIGSYRADLAADGHVLRTVVQELSVRRQCHELTLSGLDPGAVQTYLEQRFAERAGQWAAVADRMHRRSEGHPLFVCALADALAGPCTTVASQPLPARLHDFVDLGLRHLDDGEQRILEAAAVAGATFAVGVVAAALGVEAERVEQVCERLSRRGQFISDAGVAEWPDGTVSGRYRFDHILYPELLQCRIGSARWVRWRRRIGERLEQAFASRKPDRVIALPR